MAIYQEPIKADFWQLYREPGGSYLDPLGPKNCMTHTAARAVMRNYEGKRPTGIMGAWPPTGYVIRRYTGDTVGGVNHGQVAKVLSSKYKVSLVLKYGFDFDDIADLLEETRGVMLSLWYEPILDSRFRGSYTFNTNHEIWLNGVDRDRRLFTYVIDPLADGRMSGLYKGPGSYPFSLLREAAGMLNVSSTGYRALGFGKAYIAYTKATGDFATVPAPTGIDFGGTPMNQLDGPAAKVLLAGPTRKMFLKKGTPIYKWVSARTANEFARSSRDQWFVMTGIPGSGWRTVVTSKVYPDGITRIFEAYVPVGAGPIV
jgi:hypothetical protein